MSARAPGLSIPRARPQSFFDVIGLCWAMPRLLLVELTWRWVSGAFLLLLAGLAAARIAAQTGPAVQATGLFNATLESAIQDPTQVSVALASTFAILGSTVSRIALGLAPLSLFAWVTAFAFGRTALLRSYDRSLPARPWLLAVCEALRLVALLAACWLWYAALHWAAAYALGPATEVPGTQAGAQAEPNLVLYSALVICITIGLITLWSLLSWSLVAAPIVALLDQTSIAAGFARSLRMRPVRGKLVEVNLSMSVIKLGLVVLAMVLSATPLPFESIMEGWPLYAWWTFVTLLYLAASDFFKMARLLAFVEYWRGTLPAASRAGGPAAEGGTAAAAK
jgi:hypothetical protein